jgi:hypothetical protein
MEMTMKMAFGETAFTMRMDGAYDYEDELGKASMTMAAPDVAADVPELSGRTKMVFDGTFMYLKGPLTTAYGASGKGWSRMDLREMPGGATQMNQDPSQYIDFLRTAGAEVDETGTEDIGGVRTTHYTAEIAFEDLIAQTENAGDEYLEELEALGGEIAPVELEAWIDDEGLPRRISMAMTITGVDDLPGGGMTMRAWIDLFDYGVDVEVQVPKKFEDIAAVPTG